MVAPYHNTAEPHHSSMKCGPHPSIALVAILLTLEVQSFRQGSLVQRQTPYPNCRRSDGHLLSFSRKPRHYGPLNASEKDGESVKLPVLPLLAFSLLTSILTIWSEVAVYETSCGPLNMPDWVERSSYQAVIFVSGLTWFLRIVFRKSLADLSLETGIVTSDDNLRITAIRFVETVNYVAVVLAVFILLNQMQNNVEMDGLSGIDIAACKARREFLMQ